MSSIHPSATIDEGATIGEGTRIWHHCHVSTGATLGRDCSLGQNVYVGPGVVVGDRAKIQNNVSLYAGVTLEDEVFCGPSCVFTNVLHPRAALDRRAAFLPTLVRRGTTIGANATILCGATLGRHSFIAAGAVVTRASSVPDYALMMGLPARHSGWVGRHGHRLVRVEDALFECPESGWRYREASANLLRCLDLDEDAGIPSV